MRVIALCGALLLATGAVAQEPPGPAQAQGHADRQAFEAWVQALPADQHRGADFWAQERSKPKPQPCAARGVAEPADFTKGCDQARGRLSAFDARRKIELDYRTGWNAPIPNAPIPQAPVVTGPSSDRSGLRELQAQVLKEQKTEAGGLDRSREMNDKIDESLITRVQSAIDTLVKEGIEFQTIDGQIASIGVSERRVGLSPPLVSHVNPSHQLALLRGFVMAGALVSPAGAGLTNPLIFS